MSAGTGLQVELRAATLRYPGASSDALGPVDLSLARGSQAVLLGPSGAGKTTLLRLAGAALPPTAGEVRLDGADPSAAGPRQLRALRRRVGFIHQDFRLVPQLRVVHNVVSGRLGQWSLPASLRRMLWPPMDLLEEVHRLLERLGLEDKLFERTDRLSGGQMQRVAVARALFQGPDLIVADEPVSALDRERAESVLEVLTTEARARGTTLLLSLHREDLAEAFFARHVRVSEGQVEAGPIDGVPDFEGAAVAAAFEPETEERS